MELLVVFAAGLLGIATAAAIGPRLQVAAPLLLVLFGAMVSAIPGVPDVRIDPEWILIGVLPPLLYSASVQMSTREFKQEFATIRKLSIALVVASSLLLGLLFSWLIPDLGIAAGIALGAILSPTDAVATSIVKRAGVSPRIVTVLEGEGLLNDATALVILRTAIAATAASVTFWSVAGQLIYAVLVAAAIGCVIGWLNLWTRSRLREPTVATVISFAVPFIASVPAEMLGASGLVAAVAAGLVTGSGAAKRLTPSQRISDRHTWSSIALVLEGGVFLVFGLESAAVIGDLTANQDVGIGFAVLLSIIGLVGVVLVRALYVTSVLSTGRLWRMLRTLVTRGVRAVAGEAAGPPREHLATKANGPGSLAWKEGAVIVFSGLRGAVTLAAAQTLPSETPHRSLLVSVAFLVAVLSLLGQGSTLGWVVGIIKPPKVDPELGAAKHQEISRILHDAGTEILDRDAAHVAAQTGVPEDALRQWAEISAQIDGLEGSADSVRRMRLAMVAAQRSALLAAATDGRFGSHLISAELDALDSEQAAIEQRLGKQ